MCSIYIYMYVHICTYSSFSYSKSPGLFMLGPLGASLNSWKIVWQPMFKVRVCFGFTRGHHLFHVSVSYDFHSRFVLPNLLLGLAVALYNEDRARAIGMRILDQIHKCPGPPPANDELTWYYLQDGCEFRANLELFVEDLPLKETSLLFRMHIVIFRLMPCCETVIEAKHAQVAINQKRHPVGPVRVSLSNRLPMLERRLALQPSYITQFMECLNETRQFKQCLKLFDFASHPLITRKTLTRDFPMLLSHIFYQCDLPTSFRSLKQYANKDKKSRDLRALQEKRFSTNAPVAAPGRRRAFSTALRDHFLTTHRMHSFYRIPAEAHPKVTRLDDFVADIGTDEGLEVAEGAIVPWADERQDADLIFQVGLTGLGQKKTLKASIVHSKARLA
jgi:hypothetical protein